MLVHLLRAVCQRLEKAVAARLRRGQQRHPASCGGASTASTGRGGVSSFELGSADRMPSAVTAICASLGSPPLERAARRGGEADAVAPFEAHLHVAHVRPRLAQRGHQPTSAEHLVGARGHLVDEHDDARCARRAAWLRSCAICPTSWRGLAYVSSEFARTWNAIESTTTRRTLRPGRPGALFACLCVPATRRKCDVQASPPIAHGECTSDGPNDELN